MPFNVTRKLIGSHLVSGEMTPGEEIAIHIDQTLTQGCRAGTPRRAGEGTQHLESAEVVAAARRGRGAGAAQGRRQYLHRRDLPGRRTSAAVSLQHQDSSIWVKLNIASLGATLPRAAGCHRQVLRPHPLAEPRQLRSVALEFENPGDYDTIDQGDTLRIQHLRDALANKDNLQVDNLTKKSTFTVRHRLSPRQVQDVLAGGLIARLAQVEN